MLTMRKTVCLTSDTHLHGLLTLRNVFPIFIVFSLLFVNLMLTAQTAEAATYTVTNNAASGAGSFLDAFTQANVSGHSDTISFDPTSFDPASHSVAQRTITLGANLATLVASITINGDVNGDAIPDVILNGGGFTGIVTTAASVSVTLQSMAFTNFKGTNGTTANVVRVTGASSSLTITDSIFYENGGTNNNGGAVQTGGTGTSVSIDRSVFYSNVAVLNGGALYLTGSGGGTISNSVFYDNQASGTTAVQGGGAIRYQSTTASTLNVYNVTIVGNRVPNSSGAGGGIQGSSVSGVNVNIYDSIIADNTGPSGVASDTNAVAAGGSVTLTNVTTGSGAGLFVNEGSGANRDLRLISGSTAIDAGSATSSSPNATYDLLNNPRKIGSNYDRGAYEYDAARTLTLDANNSSGSTGNNYIASAAATQNVQVNVADTDTAIGSLSGDTNVRSVILTLGGVLDGTSESLLLSGSNPNINSVQYDSSTGYLILYSKPAATVADMQAAIHNVVYQNAAATPTTGARTVSVVASDASDSAAATATITLGGSTPTVTTQARSAIAATSATGNGTITSLGTPNPTQYGVVWNTSGTPTTASSKTSQGAIAATGAFTSSMTGLTANTTYHVRAYATNTAGTSYGSDVSFTTSAPAPTVTSITPNRGVTAGGTSVTITGTGFVSNVTVTIGGLPATVLTVSATSITATTRAGSVGAKDVVVTNPDTQTGTLTNGFNYFRPGFHQLWG